MVATMTFTKNVKIADCRILIIIFFENLFLNFINYFASNHLLFNKFKS